MSASDSARSTPSAPNAPGAPGTPNRFVTDAVEHPIDEWGRNEQFVALLDPLFRLRWSVHIDGLDHLGALPAGDGALLVANRRWWALDLVWTAWALGRRLERPVRFVGHPDRVPSGPVLRRLGALIEHPAEVRGALRHGETVVLGADASWHPRTVGDIDPEMLHAATETGVAVLPLAVIGSPVTRRALLRIGTPVGPPAHRRGPLADTEFAELTQSAVQRLLHHRDGGVVAPRRSERRPSSRGAA